jgi:hypothetical protein
MNAWISYALEYPTRGSLGQPITLSGFNMFVSVQMNLLNLGGSIVSTIPVNRKVAPLEITSMTADYGDSTLSLTWTAPEATSEQVILQFSPPQSAGRNFCKIMWQMDTATESDDAYNDRAANYPNQFPVDYTGMRIFAKVTPINEYGIAGVPATANCIST